MFAPSTTASSAVRSARSSPATARPRRKTPDLRRSAFRSASSLSRPSCAGQSTTASVPSVALPPGVIPRDDEDIEEKRKSNELLPTWRRDEPKTDDRNFPDLALKSEPAKAESKVVKEVPLSNNLPDLVTCNDLSEIERKNLLKKTAANDLANNNVVHIDAPRKLVNISESTRAKADIHHSQDLAKAKPKVNDS